MPLLSPTTSDSELLCEACGYSIDSLPTANNCPECGRPIIASVPSHRAGSPFQNRPTFFGLLLTAAETLRRPGELFARLSITPRRAWLLAVVYCATAAFFLVLPWVGQLIGDPARNARGVGGPILHALSLLAWVIGTTLVLLTLTFVEYNGIRFIAARRKWRLTRAAAAQVCAHACVGWIFSGLLPFLFLAILTALQRLFKFSPSGHLDLSPYFSAKIPWSDITVVGGLVTSVFLGLFLFELLVYIGVRRCKFATTLAAEAAPATPAVSAE